MVVAWSQGFQDTDGAPSAANNDELGFVCELLVLFVLLVAQLIHIQ